jgi:ADP-heptose:LPS heptosyltransferase
MSTSENLELRISKLREKLDAINSAMAKEMAKVYKQRNDHGLRFLYLEREVYSLALNELEAVYQGGRGPLTEKKFPVFDPGRVIDYTKTGVAKPNERASARQIHRLVTWGGIGDVLLMTPAIRAFKQRDPSCSIHVYCEHKLHREVLKNNPYIDRLIFVGRWGRAALQVISERKWMTFRWANFWVLAPGLLYNNPAAQVVGEKLGLGINDTQLDCFLTEEEAAEARKITSQYRNPVIININSNSSRNKHWPIENWERLVLNNPQYDFLQLGLAREEPVRGAKNLLGKTTLRQSLGIVKAAKAFVGVDSSMAHVAAAFRIPAVVLFGPSSPNVYGHAASRNLYNAPRCSPCMEIIGNVACPYGKPCMTNITVSDVEQALSCSIACSAERSRTHARGISAL